MSELRRGWAGFLLALGLAAPLPAQSAEELLRLADRPRESLSEAILHVRATVLHDGKSDSPAEFDLYRKGEDRALVVFTAGRQKGRKVLTVGDKFWLLVPGSARPIPVTANQRLMGGAAMGDVAKLRFSSEFRGTLAPGAESVDGLECDVVELAAARAGASYASGRLWMDRREHLPRRALLSLLSGKPAKEVLFESYGTQAGVTVLRSQTVKDLLSPGLATRLEYSAHRRAKLPDSMFTPEGALAY